MRLFRKAARDTKTSVIRREAVAVAANDESVSLKPVIAPIVDSEPTLPEINNVVPSPPPSYEQLDDSDVFVTNAKAAPALREVTLFVHQWHNVEPGLLSWTFPSLRAALDSVQRMKNAVGWCIVSGTNWTNLDAARANGAVLVEQLS